MVACEPSTLFELINPEIVIYDLLREDAKRIIENNGFRVAVNTRDTGDANRKNRLSFGEID